MVLPTTSGEFQVLGVFEYEEVSIIYIVDRERLAVLASPLHFDAGGTDRDVVWSVFPVDHSAGVGSGHTELHPCPATKS